MAIFKREVDVKPYIPQHCYSGSTIRLPIYLARDDQGELPKDLVGWFNLCARRWHDNSLPECATCRKEVNEWAWSIKADYKVGKMVGSYYTFISKRLNDHSKDFTIFPRDKVAPVVRDITEPINRNDETELF